MDFARQLKSNIDIVQVIGEYVRLKKAGTTYKGLCPFHTEKTPSFNVRPSHQAYKCFGCNAGGDTINFVMEIEGVSFWEACKLLGERYGIPLPKRLDQADAEAKKRTGVLEMHELAQKLFRETLGSPAGAAARDYLKRRGVSAKLAEEFGLGLTDRQGQALTNALLRAGFTPAQFEESGLAIARNDGSGYFDRFRGRLMFPIHSESGQVIGFGGRALSDEDQPKYLNSSETPIYRKSRVLYNLHRARKSIRQHDRVVLVEGYMDVIGLYGAGVGEVVASCGTALTSDQVRMMRRHSENIVVNFDPDPAGAAAAERSIQMLLDESMHIRVLALPEDLDPDEFIAKHGLDHYRALLEKAPRYFEWLSDRARERFDVRSAEGRVEAFKFLLPAIQRLPDKIERAAVANDVAAQLGVDKGLVLEQFKRLAAARSSEPMKAPPPQAPPVEKMLVRCLLQSAEAREAALPELSKLSADHFLVTGAILRAVAAVEEPFQYSDLEARLQDGDRALLGGIAFADQGREEIPDPVNQAKGCVEKLLEAAVEAERAALKARIAEASQQGNVVEALRLSEHLSQLAGSGRRRRLPVVE